MIAKEILNVFISNINKYSKIKQFECRQWIYGTSRHSRNIYELSGLIDCLIYIKVRSEEPYRWGVTANRIKEIKNSRKNWIIVLLYGSSEKGHLLTPIDIQPDSEKRIWPLCKDGDYKVCTDSFVKYNTPFKYNKSFNSFKEFLDSLFNLRD